MTTIPYIECRSARGGWEVENSMHYGEIGEMAGRPGGGQELKNSMHYGEIGEMRWPIREGSGNGEFDALWRNRGNKMTGSGHWPMFIKTMPCS